jgi:hypothetical protein
LSAPVIEGLADGGIGSEAAAVVEAALVGEELDVNDVEAVKFAEEVGSGVGCGGERIIGMLVQVLLEDAVGGGEVDVVHVEVALVEAGGVVVYLGL